MDKLSTYELIHKLTYLEHTIDKNVLEYNNLLRELLRRFPNLEQQEEFKPKILSKGEIKI